MKLQNCTRRPSFSRPELLEGKAGGDDSPSCLASRIDRKPARHFTTLPRLDDVMKGHLGLFLGGIEPRDDRHTPADETNPFPFTRLSRLVALSSDPERTTKKTFVCFAWPIKFLPKRGPPAIQ